MNEYIPILGAALAFIVVLLLMIGIMLVSGQRARSRNFIQKIDHYGGGTEAPEHSGVRTKTGVWRKALDMLSALGEKIGPDKSLDYPDVRVRFLRAGFRHANVSAVFWGAKLLLVTLLPLCFFSARLTMLNLLNPQMTIIICVFLALIGYYLPDIWLRIKADRRKNKIFEGLPDALDLLVVCVESGMGLDAAIHRVAEEISLSNKPLSDELKLMNLELRAGKSRQDALRNLAMRTDLEELKNFATLLIQTDRFGTSVAQALRVYSDAFRTKRYQRAEEIAAKLPVKLVLPLIFFIFPSLFVVILGPSAIRAYQILLSR